MENKRVIIDEGYVHGLGGIKLIYEPENTVEGPYYVTTGYGTKIAKSSKDVSEARLKAKETIQKILRETKETLEDQLLGTMYSLEAVEVSTEEDLFSRFRPS